MNEFNCRTHERTTREALDPPKAVEQIASPGNSTKAELRPNGITRPRDRKIHTRHVPRRRQQTAGRDHVESPKTRFLIHLDCTHLACVAPTALSINQLSSEARPGAAPPTRHRAHTGAPAASCSSHPTRTNRHPQGTPDPPPCAMRALNGRQPPTQAVARGCALGSRPRPSGQSTALAHGALPDPLRDPLSPPLLALPSLPPPLLAQPSALPSA